MARALQGVHSMTRYVLGSLLAFVAANAVGGGFYGVSGAEGVPIEWLRGSPFTTYLVPSLILVVAVGGSFLVAAIAVFARWRAARLFATAAGAILLTWIAVEVAIIGCVSWLQPVTAIVGLVVVVLALRLPP